MEAAGPGPGAAGSTKARRRAKNGQVESGDAKMDEAPAEVTKPPLDRSELQKKLRAKLAGASLDRTAGQNKFGLDSRGMPKRRRPPASAPQAGGPQNMQTG